MSESFRHEVSESWQLYSMLRQNDPVMNKWWFHDRIIIKENYLILCDAFPVNVETRFTQNKAVWRGIRRKKVDRYTILKGQKTYPIVVYFLQNTSFLLRHILDYFTGILSAWNYYTFQSASCYDESNIQIQTVRNAKPSDQNKGSFRSLQQRHLLFDILKNKVLKLLKYFQWLIHGHSICKCFWNDWLFTFDVTARLKMQTGFRGERITHGKELSSNLKNIGT